MYLRLVITAALCASGVGAQVTTRTRGPTSTASATSVPSSDAAPCAVVSQYQAQYRASCKSECHTTYCKPCLTSSAVATEVPIPANIATSCLESVPLDSSRSSDLVDFIGPYIELQSTLGYLKTPPSGYLVPGVDILGGLATIKQNLQNNVYTSQYAFEKDLYFLLNVFPHDGHLSYALPLFNVFNFATGTALMSLSEDGVTLPKVYVAEEIQQAIQDGSSVEAIATINGMSAFDYLQNISMSLASSPQDPDAMYNEMFLSVARETDGLFSLGAWQGSMDSETTTLVGENGNETQIDNVAFATIDFNSNDITSGSTLHTLLEVPSVNSMLVKKHERRDLTEKEHHKRSNKRQFSSENTGYPSNPVAIHSSGGYVAGYFLEGTSDTAVLAVKAFQALISGTDSQSDNAEMQTVIQDFLTQCKSEGRTKLIIDLQGNGGGSIFNGFDLFKQLFPSVDPFGGTRFRATSSMNYIGQTFTTYDAYDRGLPVAYTTQANVDKDGKDFSSWNALYGPVDIYADTFTNILRYNFSDPVASFEGNGIYVYGYGRLSQFANSQAPFEAENIVMVYDGICASTCTIFSQLMKAQAGVRSIAFGGRPLDLPMQAVGGTKGAQVQSFALLQALANVTVELAGSPPSGTTLPSLSDPPMYPALGQSSPGLNWRNNYDSNDLNTPLQFVYEAANCKLFFRPQDVYDISSLWGQAYNVTWGGQPCVSGSTTNSDNKIPTKATDTIAYNANVLTNTTAPTGPGTIGGVSVNGQNTPTTPSGTSSSPAGTTSKASAGEMIIPQMGGVALAVVAAVFAFM